MTKKERAALVAIMQKAVRYDVEANARADLRPITSPTGQFNRGFAWGVHEALSAVGFSYPELYDIWHEVTQEPTAEAENDLEARAEFPITVASRTTQEYTLADDIARERAARDMAAKTELMIRTAEASKGARSHDD